MKDGYKFILCRDGKIVKFTVACDVGVDELVEAFKYFMLGCSWCPETVKEAFNEYEDGT